MGLFNRSPKKQELDSLSASRILERFEEILLESAAKKIEAEESSHHGLAQFRLIFSAHLTRNILELEPRVACAIDAIFAETSAYYDYLWQSILLNKYDDAASRNKISHLYAWVEFSASSTLKEVLNESPRAEAIFGQVANSQYYSEIVTDTINTYINGIDRLNVQDGDVLINNAFTFQWRLTECLGRHDIKIATEPLSKLIIEDTTQVFSFKLIARFDLEKCIVPELPDDWYSR